MCKYDILKNVLVFSLFSFGSIFYEWYEIDMLGRVDLVNFVDVYLIFGYIY